MAARSAAHVLSESEQKMVFIRSELERPAEGCVKVSVKLFR